MVAIEVLPHSWERNQTSAAQRNATQCSETGLEILGTDYEGGGGAYVDPSGGESSGGVSDLLLRGVPVLAVPVADTCKNTRQHTHTHTRTYGTSIHDSIEAPRNTPHSAMQRQRQSRPHWQLNCQQDMKCPHPTPVGPAHSKHKTV